MKENKFLQIFKHPLQTLKKMWHWVLYRTTHKFHIIKLKTLEPGYYDIDHRMLHACFQLLVEYVEKEKPFDIIEWDADEESRHVALEIKDLYFWWKNAYPARHEPIHDVDRSLVPPLSVICSGNLSEYPAWDEACNKTLALTIQWSEEDDRNLIRLMKIRSYLWT